MVKTFITIVLLLVFCGDADAQLFGRWGRGRSSGTSQQRTSGKRDCQSARCLMCALNYGPLPGYAIRGNQVVWVGFQSVKPKPTLDPIKAELAATPQAVVDIMLVLAGLTPDDVLLDPGCGDARFLTTAAKRYGCECIGIEINQEAADKSEADVEAACVSDRVLIIRGDARKIQINRVTVVVLYLFPKDIETMRPNWQNARMVVSYLHEIPGVVNRSLNLSIEGQEHRIFFWVKE